MRLRACQVAIVLALSGMAASTPAASGQALSEASTGPVITGYGAVYDVADPDLATPNDRDYRIVFDVSQGAAEATAVNPRIDTLARFLNMHARAGVARERVHLALVLHGTAGKDALDDRGYRARFDVDNPNLPLLEALADAGVDIYLCGQTAVHRGLRREELAAPVQVALSAMTVLATLQSEGYSLIGS